MPKQTTPTIRSTWDEYDTAYNLLWWKATGDSAADDRNRIERILTELRDFPDQTQDGGEAIWRLPARCADRAYLAATIRRAARRSTSAGRPVLYISAEAAHTLADRISPTDRHEREEAAA